MYMENITVWSINASIKQKLFFVITVLQGKKLRPEEEWVTVTEPNLWSSGRDKSHTPL